MVLVLKAVSFATMTDGARDSLGAVMFSILVLDLFCLLGWSVFSSAIQITASSKRAAAKGAPVEWLPPQEHLETERRPVDGKMSETPRQKQATDYSTL